MSNSTLLSFLSLDTSANIAIVIVNAVDINIESTDVCLKDGHWTRHLFLEDEAL